MSITTIPVLEDLQGPWANFTVQLNGPGPSTSVQLRDVFPFMSVQDIKRLLWIQMGGDPRWSPSRVFLGVRSTAGIRPIEFHWPLSVNPSIDLQDPLTHRTPSPALVDEAGNRKPVSPTMIGSLLIETALSPEIMQSGGTLPVIEAISLSALTTDLTPELLTNAVYSGYYQFYFPWLKSPAEVLDAGSSVMNTDLRDSYAAAVPFMEDRIGRIGIVQAALQKRVGGTAFTLQTMVSLHWDLPPPMSKPESLEKTFYGIRASETIPFVRYFPAGGKSEPILKLGLQTDGSPILMDPKVFASYLNTSAIVTKTSMIQARIPIQSAHVEKGSAFTLYMYEDGNSDITLEVPQRGMTYISAVAADAQRILRDVIQALGFPATATPILRNIHATYKWTHPDPRKSSPLSASRLMTRVAALTPFLDPVPTLPEDKATAVFKWRAVSNYESETGQFAFITQLILRSGKEAIPEGEESLSFYIGELQKKFGITAEVASATMERWFERRADAVAPAAGPTAGTFAVAKHGMGATVAIYVAHPEYRVEVQNIASMEDLQRLLSVIGILLGAPAADLTIQAPVPQVAAVATVVQAQDIAVQETTGGAEPEADVELGEMDPAMAALLADLGYDIGGFGENVGGEEEETGANVVTVPMEQAAPELVIAEMATQAAAPLPDLDAIAATVEEECRGVRWAPGEPALKISPDYYMAKLKKEDSTMFVYPRGPRSKPYSKSCQRRDERQPNIMTLAEYARVKRCYEGRVRFVNLPPTKPDDLPKFTGYNPKKKYDDDYFTTDPDTGLPMWSVYGYESKTNPGQFLYLMCSEYWCERDNLPILSSELNSEEGRGFTKKRGQCPFCAGDIIRDFENPKSGESVIQRLPKEATGKLHGFIGFITSGNKHPKGWPLPCCDTTPRLLKKYLTTRAAGKLVYGRDLGAEDDEAPAVAIAAAANGGVEDYAEPAPELEIDTAPVFAGLEAGEEPRIDYRQKLTNMPSQYILGYDKSLEAGKIGLLSPTLDAFFGQNGLKSLESRGIRPTFVDGAYVFVRVGVDTRIRQPGMNLFAGLAPLLGLESADQVMRHVMSQRMVRAFESANYGTLVHEFAARSDLSDDEIKKAIQTFASDFGYQLDMGRPHVIRLFKAWTAFLQYLSDAKTPKQLRHLEHLLAQPGVLAPRGLLLIVLEQHGDKISVVCPSFGIPTASIFGDVPVSFMWHDLRDDSWEPIVFYKNAKNAVLYFGERSPDLEEVPKGIRQSIQQWIRDWRSSSLGCGRPAPPPHVWTPDRDTSMLPRLTPLRQKILNYVPTTLVRDRSNRLAGVLFSAGFTKVFVPCLDDGALADQLPRIFEADMIPPAPLDTYLRFYTAQDGLVSQFKGLTPRRLLERDGQIIGFQVEAGTMVPVSPQPVTVGNPTGLPIDQLDMFAWERDALILRSPDAPITSSVMLEESKASVEEQFTEAYEHLRLSFSKWLVRDTKGPTMRKNIATILKAKIPLYEKRKRMDVLLEPKLREFIVTEQTEERKSMPLLREDCSAIPTEEACGEVNACRWSGGRCLIHVPVRDATKTEPVRIFTARLSDELLRYAEKRKDLLEDHVMTIRTPRGILRIGNELYMATRVKESADDIMERLGFGQTAAMAFPEELVQFVGMEEEQQMAIDESDLPPSWKEKGLELPAPMEGIEDVRGLSFASATAHSLDDWEDTIKERRKSMGLSGDPDRPLQWSDQDYYVIATMLNSNLLWVRLQPNGTVKVTKWIAPTGPMVAKMKQPIFMIFWGPDQMVVTSGKAYRFETKNLPGDLLTAMDSATPMAEEEIQGEVVEEEVAEAIPTPVEVPVAAPIPSIVPAAVVPTPTPTPNTITIPTVPVVPEVDANGQMSSVRWMGQTPPPTVAPTMESDKGQPPPPAVAPTTEGILPNVTVPPTPEVEEVRSNAAVGRPTNTGIGEVRSIPSNTATAAPTNAAVAGTNTITLPTETGDEGEEVTITTPEPSLSPVAEEEEETKEGEESEGKEEAPGLLERVTNAITSVVAPVPEPKKNNANLNLDLNLNVGTEDLEGAQVLEGGAY